MDTGGRERLALIRKACRYMPDDMAIAQIFGVLPSIVAKERDRIEQGKVPALAYKAAGISDATYHIDTEARDRQARAASLELLKRLIVYGLNNDSDLGMGYEAFMGRARELGLAA